MSPIRAIRRICNRFGFAWWAKIETETPNTTYWFGPFLTKRSLKQKVSDFINDLSGEGARSIQHRFIRCRKVEPLTS